MTSIPIELDGTQHQITLEVRRVARWWKPWLVVLTDNDDEHHDRRWTEAKARRLEADTTAALLEHNRRNEPVTYKAVIGEVTVPRWVLEDALALDRRRGSTRRNQRPGRASVTTGTTTV